MGADAVIKEANSKIAAVLALDVDVWKEALYMIIAERKSYIVIKIGLTF